MKTRLSILYSCFVRMATIWLPDVPVFMYFRGFLYSLMMKHCGKNFLVPSTVIINSLSGLWVGDNVGFGHRTIIIATDLTIEDEAIIGPNCLISGGNHTFQGRSYRFGPHAAKPVIIKSGSWICGNCVVTAGSILPARSVLTPGSVLTKAFKKSDSIYSGQPAKFVVETHNELPADLQPTT
ncbi:acyltransferase [Mucilaginibacter limnophilus]|uniref:Acyltransferase n=1 Tax=Mucilaginibacter limnophilus TaxID=1932778 RepID=A0A437MSW1_9SPHI|nr:acyltransferase [Mucilaginibacter limnophilus]RVU00730.1 acyltransferase [Mucilaginibacter limnophilus]